MMHTSNLVIHKIVCVILCWFLCNVRSIEQSPRIIIVGSGAAGIAAASRLYQYGFDNVTIFEAENRIGGRVFTQKFGDYWVDLGGQWVHGDVDNVAYELAWPLGLLEHSVGPIRSKFFSSSGPTIPEATGNEMMDLYFNLTEVDVPEEYFNRSIGDFFTTKINEYFDERPEISGDLRESLRTMLNLFEMGDQAGNSWFDVAVDSEIIESIGDRGINWKDKGYSTILDILMKKIPNPAEELPVMNNTVLNSVVSRINYNIGNGSMSVVMANGNVHPADHVIVTASIGVLKSDHQTLFNPPLPAVKINAIESYELGSVAKIYLLYSEPWWIEPNSDASPNQLFNFHWTENDRNEYANDPERSWMLSMFTATIVEHKSRLLCCWLAGPHAREMEYIPTDRVFEQTKQLFRRFFGRSYNISEPVAMLRTNWYTNKNFRGTWSYRSLRTQRSGARAIDLEEPIRRTTGEPLVQFAGEATDSKHPSTVNGAIESGWREAKRLNRLYAGRRFLAETSNTGKEFWSNFESGDPTLTKRLVASSWQSVVAKKMKIQ